MTIPKATHSPLRGFLASSAAKAAADAPKAASIAPDSLAKRPKRFAPRAKPATAIKHSSTKLRDLKSSLSPIDNKKAKTHKPAAKREMEAQIVGPKFW